MYLPSIDDYSCCLGCWFEVEKYVFTCHHKVIYSKTPTLLAKITAAIPATQDTEKRQRLGFVDRQFFFCLNDDRNLSK